MAGILRIPHYAGLGIAAMLFQWAVEIAPSHNGEVDLSGDVLDDDPATFIAAGVGWEGDAEALYSALVRVGFVVQHSGMQRARIKGLHEYLEVLASSKERKEHAKRAADARWAEFNAVRDAQTMLDRCSTDAQAMLGDAKTQTQTQTQTSLKTPAANSELSTGSPQRSAARRKAGSKRDWAPPGPFGQQLCDIYREVTLGSEYPWGPDDADAVEKLLEMKSSKGVPADPEEALARWRTALKQSFLPNAFPTTRTLSALAKNWANYPTVKRSASKLSHGETSR